MEYTSLHTIQYYDDLASLVESIGYYLVELKVVPLKTEKRVTVIIACKANDDGPKGIGTQDCVKVTHLIEPKLDQLFGPESYSMEVSSPGMERNIRNAAEFVFFKGQMARVWDRDVSDWVSGIIADSNETSVTLEVKSENAETVQKVFNYEGIAKAKLLNS